MTLAALLAGRWTGRGLALAAGLAAALAHQPYGLLPGLLGYPLIMALADKADTRRPLRSSFFRGWLAGVGFFALSTWWVGEAFLVDARQAWMAPFAVGLMAGGLALFWGAAAQAYRWAAPKGVVRVLTFAAMFSAAEWLRGNILTGFPWNLPGETWRAGSAPSQAAALIGVYGLTVATVSIACGLAVVREGKAGRAAAAVALASLAALYAFGAVSLTHEPTTASARPTSPIVRIVQADVKQEAKWDPAYFQSILGRYLALSRRPAPAPVALTVWPEGALPASANDMLAPGAWTRPAIASAIPSSGVLLMGAYRVDGTAAEPVYFNSLLALGRQGDDLAVEAIYDKHHLTPFGEYVPLDDLATALGLKTLAHVGDGFTPGATPRPIVAAGLRLQPLICYESLFPGLVRKAVRDGGVRPAALINISNDAWFGATAGPLQHLNLASYRAIEQGLPIVRATPTGVSAVIDARGRTVARINLSEAGVIDAPLPPAMPATPYARIGEGGFLALMVLFIAFTILGRKNPRAL